MNRKVVVGAVVFAFLALTLPGEAQRRMSASARAERANRALARWLDQDVAFIITGEEKAAFKALQTDEEREQFIEQFWLRRDPTPDTIGNEYREDHYVRIAYANERFASGKPGWKTDRGRIYIIHGPPDGKESHPSGGTYDRPFYEGGGTTTTYPFEIWTYRYIDGIGNDVNFEFVDPTMTGEYRLSLNPFEKDALANTPTGGLTLEEEMSDDPAEAKANRGLNQMSGGLQRFSQFERLDLYAKAFKPPEIKFKDLETIVTTNISYNLLPFEVRTDFVRVTEESVLAPVTLQIQNEDIAFQQEQGIHRSLINVFGRVTGINGRVATTFEDTIRLDIPDALFAEFLTRYSVWQKIIPLRPGLYKIDLVLKDLHSDNVGTINQRLAVPRFPEEQLAASSLILADLIEPLPPRQVGSGAFVLGSSKVRPSVKQNFRQDRDLNYWIQIYNLQIDENLLKPSATVETLITRDGQEVRKLVESTDELSGAAQQMTIKKSLALADFEPGEYSIRVRITDNLSGEIITQTSKFVVQKSADATDGSRQ
jgi:GWxTD domain-containing protein